jgi:ribosomal protein S1
MLETTSKAEEWAHLKSDVHIGDILHGKVLAHWPFGIFVDIGRPFVGLIEIVNLRERGQRITPTEFPPLGAGIRAVVVDFTDHNHQVRLSMRPSDLYNAASPSQNPP